MTNGIHAPDAQKAAIIRTHRLLTDRSVSASQQLLFTLYVTCQAVNVSLIKTTGDMWKLGCVCRSVLKFVFYYFVMTKIIQYRNENERYQKVLRV